MTKGQRISEENRKICNNMTYEERLAAHEHAMQLIFPNGYKRCFCGIAYCATLDEPRDCLCGTCPNDATCDGSDEPVIDL